MSLSFSKLKTSALGLQDVLTFGKFKGCRICDIVQEQYEYLQWAEKALNLKYQPLLRETIEEMARQAKWKQHYEEEIEPYLRDTVEFDDLPF